MRLIDDKNPDDFKREPGQLDEHFGDLITEIFSNGDSEYSESAIGGEKNLKPSNFAKRYVPRKQLSLGRATVTWLPPTLISPNPEELKKPPDRGYYHIGEDEYSLMHLSISSHGSLSLLIGPVGSGKSYLLQYFIHVLCSEINKHREGAPTILPIYYNGNIQYSAKERKRQALQIANSIELVNNKSRIRNIDIETTPEDVEIMESNLLEITIDALKSLTQAPGRGPENVPEWPDWFYADHQQQGFDHILKILPELQRKFNFTAIFLLDNLDTVGIPLQAAAYMLGQTIAYNGGRAVLSMRPTTRDIFINIFNNFIISEHIDLKDHSIEDETKLLNAILYKRLHEFRSILRKQLREVLFAGRILIDIEHVEEFITDLIGKTVEDRNVKRIRILTDRNRRYLLEAISFLFRYAPFPAFYPPKVAILGTSDEALEKDEEKEWYPTRYAYVRDFLMTGKYKTFFPSRVSEQRWLSYMVNLFCNGRPTMPCNWFIRLNILFAAQNSQDRVLLVDSMWKDWVKACNIPQDKEGELYHSEYLGALKHLINARMLNSPSIYQIMLPDDIKGGWMLQITDLGNFYLEVCLPNFAYVRFAKDSIAWKDTPRWDDPPKRLQLAAETLSGTAKAENVARTMQLLGEYEKTWLLQRVKHGNPHIYCTLFTSGRGGCSIISSVSKDMLRRISEFKDSKVTKANDILKQTITMLEEVEYECFQK